MIAEELLKETGERPPGCFGLEPYSPVARAVDNSSDFHDIADHSIYSCPAGRTSFSVMSSEQKHTLIQEIWHNTISMPGTVPPVVFTYKALKSSFLPFCKTAEKENFEHLGNIKGKNYFLNADRIVQVGLNHTDVLKYTLYRIKCDHLFEEALLSADLQENGYLKQKELLMEEVNNPESETNKLLCRLMLCDVEQNLFRGRIRNVISDDYHFAIYFNTQKYPFLYREMHSRYQRQLGATVDDCRFSFLFRFMQYIWRRDAGKSGNRLLAAMMYFAPGIQYTKQDIKQIGNLTDTQYDSAIREDIVKEVMEMARTSRGKYDNREVDHYQELKALLQFVELDAESAEGAGSP